MGQSLAIPRVIPNDWKRLDLIVNKIKLRLGHDSSPTLTGLTLTGLTASRLIATDASKTLISSDLVSWVTGTANQIIVADAGAGKITLSTPQDIHTGASPTFAGLTLTNAAVIGSNSVVFQSGTDSMTFFQVLDADGGTPVLNVDTTNEQVTIGQSSVAYPFLLNSTDASDQIQIYHDNNNAYIKWSDGSLFLETIEETNTKTFVYIRGKGTQHGQLNVFDEDNTNFINFRASDDEGFLSIAGTNPDTLRLQTEADVPITMFQGATEGETQELQIYGYRTSDTARSLQVGVGVDAADTASFDGLSNYQFDGRIELTQQSGSANDGALWNDSTQEALQTYVSGIEQTLVGVIFTQTADKTIVNTTTETTFFATGVGTLTLPADFWVVGKTIRIEIHGDFADTGNPTVEVQAYYGATSLIDSGAIALSGLGGTEEWECEVVITCRSTGVSGTVETIIDWEYETTTGSSAIERLDVSGVLRTIDTTASGALDVTFQWGTAAAANTLTSEIAFIEVLN